MHRLLLVFVLASLAACSPSVTVAPTCPGPGDGTAATVTGTTVKGAAAPIPFRSESESASDFGPPTGFRLLITSGGSACLPGMHPWEGRTSLEIRWFMQPHTFTIPSPDGWAELYLEHPGEPVAADATSGTVTVDERAAGTPVTGSYDLTLPDGSQVRGSFDVAVCATPCW